MKLYFVNNSDTELADHNSVLLNKTKEALLAHDDVFEVMHPKLADAILIQEVNSYKNFRYIDNLLKDPLISQYADKIFTINKDDCATGLLRGLYTCIPKSRYNSTLQACVPYMEYPNELVLSNASNTELPQYLACWRGNTKSNKIRERLFDLFDSNQDFQLESTSSWFDHPKDEKEVYVEIMQNAKFSLCPAGWAPVSHRIYESMALGRCPVILADNFVPPKGPTWKEFALFIPESKLSNLHSYLLMYEPKYRLLGKKAYKAWQSYFSPSVVKQYYASALLTLIKTTPKCSVDSEAKHWKSLSLFWSNRWTIPQRLVNKLRRIAQVWIT